MTAFDIKYISKKSFVTNDFERFIFNNNLKNVINEASEFISDHIVRLAIFDDEFSLRSKSIIF